MTNENHLAAQGQILTHLAPETDPLQAQRFFSDLQLLTALMNLVTVKRWGGIGTRLHKAAVKALYAGPTRFVDRPPRDVRSAAAQFTTAVMIIDSEELLAKFAQPIPRIDPRAKNVRRDCRTIWNQYAPSCRPRLRTILAEVMPHL